MPAKFIASCHWPFAVDPSPKKVIATRASRRILNASAIPVATSAMSGSIETIPTHPSRAVAEVHVAVLAAGHARRTAHVVGEIPIRRHARGRGGRRGRGGGCRSGPPAGARRRRRRRSPPGRARRRTTRDLALLVEGERALLRGAHHHHEPKEAGAILPSQGRVSELAYAPTRDDARVRRLHIPSAFHSGPATGSPSAGPLLPLPGSPVAAPTDQGARVPPHAPMYQSVPDSTFVTRRRKCVVRDTVGFRT